MEFKEPENKDPKTIEIIQEEFDKFNNLSEEERKELIKKTEGEAARAIEKISEGKSSQPEKP